MSRRTLCGFLAVSVAIAVAGFTEPAGHRQPHIVRIVTIGDQTGPAYYSQVEQGYRFVARNDLVRPDAIMTSAVSNAGEDRASLMTTKVATK